MCVREREREYVCVSDVIVLCALTYGFCFVFPFPPALELHSRALSAHSPIFVSHSLSQNKTFDHQDIIMRLERLIDCSPCCAEQSKSQCVAVCCSVLQCVAVCCSVLQCVAVCCSVSPCCAGSTWFHLCFALYPPSPPPPNPSASLLCFHSHSRCPSLAC